MDAKALLRKVRGFEAAALASQAAGRTLLSPSDALERAAEPWDLHPELFDTEVDAVRAREVDDVRRNWARLRKRMPGFR